MILLISILFWTAQSYDNFVVKGHVEYQGDVWRYEVAAQRLANAWLHPEEIGIGSPYKNTGYYSLFSPFAPSGEKPVYIFAIAVVKIFLLKISPGYAASAVLVVNALSILGIAICMYAILKKSCKELIAALGAVLILLNFDLYFHALLGYHIALGIFLFMLGVLASFGYKSKQFIFLSGLLHGISFFVSPHVIIPAFIWHFTAMFRVGRLFKSAQNYILFLSGILVVAVISLATYKINVLYKIPAKNAVTMLFWEQSQARLYGGKLPSGFVFLWDYYFHQLGIPLGAVFLFLCAVAVIKYLTARRKEDYNLGAVAVFTVVATYIIYNAFKLPAIGRLYSLPLVLLSMAGLCGLSELLELNFKHRVKGLENYAFLIICAVFLSGFIAHISSASAYITEEEKLAVDKMLANYPNLDVINSRDIKTADYKNPNSPAVLSKAIVKVDPGIKFRHASIFDCEFEIFASMAMKRGQRPLLAVEKYEPYQSCFLNENYYYAFCKKRWAEVVPEYAYLNTLRPGFIYYFDGRKLAEYYKEDAASLREIACPKRKAYLPPALPW
ncbi:hypothetical protein EPN18_01440 [bacterium]|nr:MAG: hypothetical protein EPN18_01440 [bacterium]